MSPTAKAANNSHHCPKSGGRWGNCRPWTGCASKPQHCVNHQRVCELHHEKHLKTELCPTCERVLDFTGSLPPPADLKARDYKPTPPKYQKQNYPNQPKGRGAKRGAGRRGNGHGKGNNAQKPSHPKDTWLAYLSLFPRQRSSNPKSGLYTWLLASILILILLIHSVFSSSLQSFTLSFVLVVVAFAVVGAGSWTWSW